MVAQYNFAISLSERRTAIKKAFHELLLGYGSRGENKGEYILDVDQFEFHKAIPYHRIIRNGTDIFFEEYGDESNVLYPFEAYPIGALAGFYDELAKAMSKKFTEK